MHILPVFISGTIRGGGGCGMQMATGSEKKQHFRNCTKMIDSLQPVVHIWFALLEDFIDLVLTKRSEVKMKLLHNLWKSVKKWDPCMATPGRIWGNQHHGKLVQNLGEIWLWFLHDNGKCKGAPTGTHRTILHTTLVAAGTALAIKSYPGTIWSKYENIHN
jgi:hypothetical protein